MKVEVDSLKLIKNTYQFTKKYKKWLQNYKDYYGITDELMEECLSLIRDFNSFDSYIEVEENYTEINNLKTKQKSILTFYRLLKIKYEPLLDSTVVLGTDSNFQEYKDYFDKSKNTAIERAKAYINDNGGIFLTPRGYKEFNIAKNRGLISNCEKYSLAYKNDIDRNYFNKCIRALEISLDAYGTNINLNKARDYGFDIFIAGTTLMHSITNKKEIAEPETIQLLRNDGIFRDSYSSFYIGLPDEHFCCKKFINHRSFEDDKVRYYINRDYIFEDGYYIIMDYDISSKKNFYQIENGKWYKIDVEFHYSVYKYEKLL